MIRWDENEDGDLSGGEIPARLRDRLDALDTDKDGTISKNEFEDGIGQVLRGRG